MDESHSEPVEPADSTNEFDPEEVRERLERLEGMVVSHDEAIPELRDAVEERERRIEELRERLDRQEAVLRDVMEVLEYVGAATDWDDFEKGVTRVVEEGSDGYPWTWENHTLDFKAGE